MLQQLAYSAFACFMVGSFVQSTNVAKRDTSFLSSRTALSLPDVANWPHHVHFTSTFSFG